MNPARSVLPVILVVALSGCVTPGQLVLDSILGPSLPEALVLDTHYSDLIVEVDYAPGVKPCRSALTAMISTLDEVTDKHAVQLAGPNPIAAQGGDYSNDDLVAIHMNSAEGSPGRRDYGSGDVAHLHVIYLDGNVKSTGDGHTAGRTAYDYGAIFIFKETFDGTYRINQWGQRDATCDLERTVLMHELGHAVGIVNRGIPMQVDHEDPDHPGHSSNPDSVMYAKLRVSSSKLLLHDLPSGFDEADLADLAAYRAS